MTSRRLRSVPDAQAPRRAVIYVRVSSVRGRSGEEFHSPEMQESACRRLADQQGLEVVDVVMDLDRTGRTFQREGMQRVMAAAAGREFDAVVFYDLSRFGRNTSESLRHIRQLHDAGVAVLSTVERIDDTPEGQFALTTFLGMAQLYSDQISRRWSDVVRANREAGKWHGHPPLGYQLRGKGVIVPDPTAAPVVAEAFRRYADGQTLGEVTDLLRTIPGSESYWRSSTRQLLRNVGVIGMVQHEGRMLPGRHEAIVDEAVWERVQSRLRDASWQPPRHAEPVHPFAGLLVCDVCSGPMSRHGSVQTVRGGPVHRYRCRRTLQGLCVGAGGPPSDKLEEEVLRQVTEYLTGLRTQTLVRAESRTRAAAARAEVKRIRAALKRNQEARGRLAVDRARRDITAEEFELARDQLRDEEATLTRLLQVQSLAGDAGPKVSEDAAAGLVARWPVATMAERNRMLRHVVREIRIRRQERPKQALRGRVEVIFL